MRDYSNKIKEFLSQYGFDYTEKRRTILSVCPSCGRADKFSFLKRGGSSICYRGKCDYGKKKLWQWLMKVASIDEDTAKAKINGADAAGHADLIKFNPWDEEKEDIDSLEPIQYPEDHMVEFFDGITVEGINYLEGRGIPLSLVREYNLKFSPRKRRVYFPVFIDGVCYGYQGRAIDKVPDDWKILGNDGIRREYLVMFYDRINEGGHAILSEGPVDAMKFHECGGNIATMGKVVTDHQIELILEKKIKKLYLALDEDAEVEMNELANKIYGVDIYRIRVPETVKRRCSALGKKADFGECSFDECRQAFMSATKINRGELVLNLV